MLRGDQGSRMKEWWMQLSREQRTSLLILCVCGTTIVGLSLLFLQSHVRDPFLVPVASLETVRPFFEQQLAEQKAADALKIQDTDRDGLNDYSESNMYLTSPYLEDTDSDGVTDGMEVARGTDPSCPSGTSCAQALVDDAGTTSTAWEPKAGNPAEIAAAVAAGADERMNNFLSGAPAPDTITPAQMRSLLTQSNLAPAGELVGMSDEQITLLYRRAYQEIGTMKSALASPEETVAKTVPSSSMPVVPSVESFISPTP
ncbi:MAG: thrombospondin type 3 repeat-containing protein [Patescibacteria group bacterium]